MMAFEKGNKWWMNRAKSGRDAIFTDPQVLKNSIQEYFEVTNDRDDWDGQNWVGKDGEEVVVKKRVPFSLKDFAFFLAFHLIILVSLKSRKRLKTILNFWKSIHGRRMLSKLNRLMEGYLGITTQALLLD